MVGLQKIHFNNFLQTYTNEVFEQHEKINPSKKKKYFNCNFLVF